ncbi:MAG: DUF4115 domain-containing protein [Polaromonas sp.]|nr:DUF4115 domain-containing protein [Polaromonas sp.]
MSEAQTTTMSPDPEPVEVHGAGVLLKQAREASGLHIAALAVLLKVPVKKLEALESDRLDLLPDAVFVRALASSVCRTLKIDPAAILARLPQTDAPKLTYQGTGINEPFRSPSDGPRPSVWTQVSRPAVLAGMVLLLAALVLIFLPAIKTGIAEIRPELTESKIKSVGIEKAMPVSGIAEVIVAPSVSSDVGVSRSESLATITATEALSGAPLAAKSSVPVTVSSPVAGSASKVVSAGAASPTFVVTANPPLATDLVVFTAKTESWVEASDAKGQVVLRRVLATGEVAGASGVLPLKVVVGRANAIQVEIRGKAFDLNAIAKDNVARFEVK